MLLAVRWCLGVWAVLWCFGALILKGLMGTFRSPPQTIPTRPPSFWGRLTLHTNFIVLFVNGRLLARVYTTTIK